jgi:hypothetical protein
MAHRWLNSLLQTENVSAANEEKMEAIEKLARDEKILLSQTCSLEECVE